MALKDCHRIHNKGFLVSLGDRLITNLGRDCGRNTFQVEWTAAAKSYVAERGDYVRRGIVRSFQDRLPQIEEELSTLINGERGARWAMPLAAPLRQRNKGLPDVVVNRVSDLIRASSGALLRTREKTDAERQASRFGSPGATEGKQSNFIEEEVGFIRGLSALHDNLSLSRLVGKDLLPELEALSKVNVETAQSDELKRHAKWTSEVDAKMGLIRQSLQEHRELLRRDNVLQFQQIATADAERTMIRQYAASLPA